MKLSMACGSDTGRVRSRNEDHVRIMPGLAFAVLADGMGGHRAGDVASRLAVEVIGDCWDTVWRDRGQPPAPGTRLDAIARAVAAANDRIYRMSRTHPECQGMGATVIAAHFDGDGLHAIHIGDSRLYQFREGRLTQLSDDHTHAQEAVRMGLIDAAAARESYGWNLLLRALGVDPVVEPDRIEMPLRAGDLHLICSDGLSDNVSDTQLADILSLHGAGDLVEAVDVLIDTANGNGGSDNISAILVRIDEA